MLFQVTRSPRAPARRSPASPPRRGEPGNSGSGGITCLIAVRTLGPAPCDTPERCAAASRVPCGLLTESTGRSPPVAGTPPNSSQCCASTNASRLDHPERCEKTMRGGRVLHIPDLVEHQLYRAGDPIVRRAVELGGVRSLVGVP